MHKKKNRKFHNKKMMLPTPFTEDSLLQAVFKYYSIYFFKRISYGSYSHL